MLDPDDVDLDALAGALDDHSVDLSFGHSWWFDPRTGDVRFQNSEVDEETIDDLDDAGFLLIEPHPSSVGYRDMEDFIDLVPDRRASDLLGRAIEGRGAFRRFKDTLFDFPELRSEWFAFAEVRGQRRAVQWLVDRRLVDERRAAEAIDARADPPVGGSASSLAATVAGDLRALYGGRLVSVLVFGSRARGDSTDDSDLDLLVVLDRVDDAWAEHRRMEEILWRHTFASGVVVTALPVAQARYEHPDEPVLLRAKAEAVPA